MLTFPLGKEATEWPLRPLREAVAQAGSPFPVTGLPPMQAVRPAQIPLLGNPLPMQATTSLQVRQAVKLQLGQAGIVPVAQSDTVPQASQENSAASQADSTGSQEGQCHTYPP